MHFPDGDGLGDGVNGRGKETGPWRKKVRELGGSFEVLSECECC